MLRNDKAQQIASAWHGGQWSALYQFCSSGQYMPENHLRYLQEVEACLHPEYALHPGTLTIRDLQSLTRLKGFFIAQGAACNLITQYFKHPVYQYQIPSVASTQTELLQRIKPIVYPD